MCSAPFFYVKKDSKFKELTTFSGYRTKSVAILVPKIGK